MMASNDVSDAQCSILSPESPIYQHYIECTVCPGKIKNPVRSLCNSCDILLCVTCEEEHKNRYNDHQIGPYFGKQSFLNCSVHKLRVGYRYCETCRKNLCVSCTKDHESEHLLQSMDKIRSKKIKCQSKVEMIVNQIRPLCEKVVENVRQDWQEVDDEIKLIRTNLTYKATALKVMVDTVLKQKLNELDEIEKSIKNELSFQTHTLSAYSAKLEDFVLSYERLTNKNEPGQLLSFHDDDLLSMEFPEIRTVSFPELVSTAIDSNAIANCFGDIKHEESLFSVSRKAKLENQIELSLKPTNAERVGSFKIPDVLSSRHISIVDNEKFWVSDYDGNLVLADKKGNKIDKVVTKDKNMGFHCINDVKELMCTNETENNVLKISSSKQKDIIIKTASWKPISVVASRVNGDIVVGMRKNKDAKVSKFTKFGKEVLAIESTIYSNPHYIELNINGDICVSDWGVKKVVVVSNAGRHPFNYPSDHRDVYPSGICTDSWGHILVYDDLSKCVHLIDKNGQFLKIILKIDFKTKLPSFNYHTRSLCTDHVQNFWLGDSHSNIVTVYRYLCQERDTPF